MEILAFMLMSTAVGAAPDVASLSPAQRQVYQRVVSEEFCSCTSALTLAGCYEKRPTCALATDIGRLVIRGVQGTDVSADDLLGYLSKQVMGPFCSSAHTFDVGDAPTLGAPGAEVTVVEFADFRCGHCRAAAPVVKQAMQRHRSNARLVFLPFPLQDNPLSVAAAEAAFAAKAQGKFWEMHDALFENQDRGFEREQLRRLASTIGLDLKKFDADLDSRRYRKQIASLKQQGLAAGVEGTPSFFVNGRRYDLDPVLFTLDERITMELNRNRGNCQ